MNLHDVTAQGVAPHKTPDFGAPIANDDEPGGALRALVEIVDPTGGREEHPLWGTVAVARRFSVPAEVFLDANAAASSRSAP